MASPGGRISPDIVSSWLDQLAARPCWAGLMTGDPFLTSDPLTVEVIGAAYRRPQFLYERVDTVLRNAAALNWRGIAAFTRVSGVAGFDKAFNGALLWYTPLPEALDYPTGGNLDFPIRELYIGIDS